MKERRWQGGAQVSANVRAPPATPLVHYTSHSSSWAYYVMSILSNVLEAGRQDLNTVTPEANQIANLNITLGSKHSKVTVLVLC